MNDLPNFEKFNIKKIKQYLLEWIEDKYIKNQ